MLPCRDVSVVKFKTRVFNLRGVVCYSVFISCLCDAVLLSPTHSRHLSLQPLLLHLPPCATGLHPPTRTHAQVTERYISVLNSLLFLVPICSCLLAFSVHFVRIEGTGCHPLVLVRNLFKAVGGFLVRIKWYMYTDACSKVARCGTSGSMQIRLATYL